jgi:hypothetical protein
VKPAQVAIAALLGLLSAAPTVGDVGGCGRTVTDLDPARFANARKLEDCQRCTACALTTQTCVRACDPTAASDVFIPSTCRPLLHDGEVCLRALHAASCNDYATFVDDVAPALPSECEFCHVAPPAPSGTGALIDGGAP